VNNNNKPKRYPPKNQTGPSPARRPPKPTRKAVAAKPEPEPQSCQITSAAAGTAERIQKILARGGVGSRREIERWIAEGKLKLNGKTVQLGDRLQAGDTLQLNERRIDWEKFAEQATRVLIYHKPTGEVVTRRDPQGRPLIFSKLPELATARWIAVGRLDINTSGLLLVTNNGELANCLMHPSTQVEREYAVRILGAVPDAMLETLKQGVELDDGPAKFEHIFYTGGEGANRWYNVIVSEGRNRLVRRLWESQQVVVSRLMRVRYGPVVLPERLRTGAVYELNQKELALLFEFAGLDKKKALAAPLTHPMENKRIRIRKPL